MFAPHSSLPLPDTQLDLILILDKKAHAASRRQLVAWSRRCAKRHGLGFVCGVSGRLLGQLTRGLRSTIYNAGSQTPVPPTDLLGWLGWQRLVIIENGRCWELPLAAKHLFATAHIPPPDAENTAYHRLGQGYSDK